VSPDVQTGALMLSGAGDTRGEEHDEVERERIVPSQHPRGAMLYVICVII